MTLNKTHPQYDPLGEMLALLPPFPHYTKLFSVASDLELTQRDITILARRAVRSGLPVRIDQQGTVRVVRMDRHKCQETQEWAEKYWNQVYCEAGLN